MIREVLARKGIHDELRKKFCALREKVYHSQNGWEPQGVELEGWRHEPYDYVLVVKDGDVIGGCVIITGSLPVAKIILDEVVIPSGSIEIARMINIGLRDIIPFLEAVFRHCNACGVTYAYATVRRKFWRKLRMMRFSCFERIGDAVMTKGNEEFIPVRINGAAVAKFFDQWKAAA